MAKIPGTAVAAALVPLDDQLPTATHRDIYGEGGWRTVYSIAERDAVPLERCKPGMIVTVSQGGVNIPYERTAGGGYVPFVPPSHPNALLFPDTVAGIAGTGSTEYFYVPIEGGLQLYRNIAGVATLVTVTPSIAQLADVLTLTVAEKNAAQTARAGAETARAGAEAARSGAETARGGAETALSGAQEALASAIVASDIATSQAGIATSQADNAKAAAEASGDVLFFDTYPAAEAALPGLPDGQVVEVFAPRSRYRVESGELVIKLKLYSPADAPELISSSMEYEKGFFAGDIIETQSEGFRYEVAATDAVDHHVETAGGVKLYVLPNSEGAVSLAQFGAIAGLPSIAQSTTALKTAVRDFDKVFVPTGEFWCAETLNVKRPVHLYGMTGTQAGSYPSKLRFEDGIVGLFMHRGDTYADAAGVPVIGNPPGVSGAADGFKVQHLEITTRTGSATVTDGTSHGVWYKCRGQVFDCFIHGWGGNGLHIVATGASTDPLFRGNANNWDAARCRIRFCQDGIFVDGADVNVGMGGHLDLSANRNRGLVDSSFLGCTWINCHFNGNANGAVDQDNNNARSTFVGCYTEPGGGNLWRVSRAAIILGGQFSGVTVAPHPDGTGWGFTSFVDAEVKVGRVLRTPNVYSKEGISGNKLDQIWNTGSISISRGAGTKYTIGGDTPGSFMDVAAIYGTGGASNVTTAGALRFDIYDPTVPGFVRALTIAGENKIFIPGTDNVWQLASASARFKEIFAANGTINTSDERDKDQIEAIPDEWLDAWGDVQWCRFKWRDAVAEKGDVARWHVGVIAQQVRDAFADRGINAFEIGLLCFDAWDEEREDVIEVVEIDKEPDGTPITEERETGETRMTQDAGDRYGIRYDQAQVMEAAWMRRELIRLGLTLSEASAEDAE